MSTKQGIYDTVRARAEHWDDMIKIFHLAFRMEDIPDYRLVTDMCKALYWANSQGHVMVVRVKDMQRAIGWFSIRERIPDGDVSATKAKDPESWYVNLSTLHNLFRRASQLLSCLIRGFGQQALQTLPLNTRVSNQLLRI